jgi:hypothetical protein
VLHDEGMEATDAVPSPVRPVVLVLMGSQFAALEEPTTDEPEIRVPVGEAPTVIARHIVERLGLTEHIEEGRSR